MSRNATAFEFRKAETNDARLISELVFPVCDRFIFPGMSGEGRAIIQLLYEPASIFEQIQTGNRFLLAFKGSEFAGAIAMRDDFHVYLFFIAECHHRQGLGTELWKHFIARANSPVRFTLNSSPYARGFYERLGFVVTGEPLTRNGVAYIPMAYLVSD